MFFSRTRLPYSGGPTFTVPFPYLAQEHIEVFVDGIQVQPQWITQSTLVVPEVPGGGTEVLIRRNTPKDSLIVVFKDGAVLKGGNLKDENLQLLYIAQEAIDDATDGIKLDEAGIYRANGKRITEVGDPVDAGDAVTLGYADAKYGGAVVDRAELARDEAIQKAQEALASAADALARLQETEGIRDEFAGALASTYDRFACFRREGDDLIVDFTTPSDSSEVDASEYLDVFTLSGSSTLAINDRGDLIIQL